MRAPVLYLAELTAWDPNLGGTRTLRFSYGRGYATGPGDTPANTYFEPRMEQPNTIRRTMFAPGATMGRSTQGFGDLVLSNPAGVLDYMLPLALDGRGVTIWRTEERDPVFPEDFTEVLVATMRPAAFPGNTVTIGIRDRQADLEVPLQPTKYAGTNVLPEGLEGVPGDLMGKPKPVCYGVVREVPAPCVNTARQIYQVHDGEIASVDGVYVRGAPLVDGGVYGSQAEMEATAPAAGEFRAWLAGGYFRLGSSPAGQVTADVTQGDTAADRTAGRIFDDLIGRARLVNEWSEVVGEQPLATETGDFLVTETGEPIASSGDVHAGDVTALDAADDSELGFWTREETTIAAVCDAVASTVGAWWGVDRTGVFRIQRFGPPQLGVAVKVIRRAEVIGQLARSAPSDPGGGLPMYRQILRWGRFHATQTSDLDPTVTNARRSELALAWREVMAENRAVQEVHLRSTEMIRESLYAYEADAAAGVARRESLYEVRHDRFDVPLHLTEETATIDLGDTVELQHERFGLTITGHDGGVPFVVIGVAHDARAGRVTLTLWGSATGFANLATEDGELLVTETGEYLITNAA